MSFFCIPRFILFSVGIDPVSCFVLFFYVEYVYRRKREEIEILFRNDTIEDAMFSETGAFTLCAWASHCIALIASFLI